jgi:hypothetical protein
MKHDKSNQFEFLNHEIVIFPYYHWYLQTTGLILKTSAKMIDLLKPRADVKIESPTTV